MITGKITAIIIAIMLATSTTAAVLVTIITVVVWPSDVAKVTPTSTPDGSVTPEETDDDVKSTPEMTTTPKITGTVTPTATATMTPTLVFNDKVTICHIPPGNRAAAHNITISSSALKAHLGHGDVLGPCSYLTPIIDVIIITATVEYLEGIVIDVGGILGPGYGGGGDSDDGDDGGGGSGGGGGHGRSGDHDRGHGNDDDHHDEDNPGKSGHK